MFYKKADILINYKSIWLVVFLQNFL